MKTKTKTEIIEVGEVDILMDEFILADDDANDLNAEDLVKAFIEFSKESTYIILSEKQKLAKYELVINKFDDCTDEETIEDDRFNPDLPHGHYTVPVGKTYFQFTEFSILIQFKDCNHIHINGVVGQRSECNDLWYWDKDNSDIKVMEIKNE